MSDKPCEFSNGWLEMGLPDPITPRPVQPMNGQFIGRQFWTDCRKLLIKDVLDEGRVPEKSSRALGSMRCRCMKSSTSLENSEKSKLLGDK